VKIHSRYFTIYAQKLILLFEFSNSTFDLEPISLSTVSFSPKAERILAPIEAKG
jgi:hypothetical protein